jgi:hypothetical protein
MDYHKRQVAVSHDPASMTHMEAMEEPRCSIVTLLGKPTSVHAAARIVYARSMEGWLDADTWLRAKRAMPPSVPLYTER